MDKVTFENINNPQKHSHFASDSSDTSALSTDVVTSSNNPFTGAFYYLFTNSSCVFMSCTLFLFMQLHSNRATVTLHDTRLSWIIK